MLTGASMWLIAVPSLAWWGFLVGLAAQPFWFASSWQARQWGIFLNAIFYTGALVAGLLNH
jgi:hypothetical protein